MEIVKPRREITIKAEVKVKADEHIDDYVVEFVRRYLVDTCGEGMVGHEIEQDLTITMELIEFEVK